MRREREREKRFLCRKRAETNIFVSKTRENKWNCQINFATLCTLHNLSFKTYQQQLSVKRQERDHFGKFWHPSRECSLNVADFQETIARSCIFREESWPKGGRKGQKVFVIFINDDLLPPYQETLINHGKVVRKTHKKFLNFLRLQTQNEV